uniref:cystatin 10-like n=1 Tax=Jaculus jaculus TaxID=51337 RepID=UPI001E1B4456|nr:cystatin 10-like [Jaculus jaculus]
MDKNYENSCMYLKQWSWNLNKYGRSRVAVTRATLRRLGGSNPTVSRRNPLLPLACQFSQNPTLTSCNGRSTGPWEMLEADDKTSRCSQQNCVAQGKKTGKSETKFPQVRKPTMPRLLCTSLLLLAALALALAVSSTSNSKSKDKHAAVGMPEPADLKSKETQQALDFAVNAYNDVNNDLYLSRPVHVMSASQQVVGGKNFYFKVVLARTLCAKSQSQTDLAKCPLNEQPGQQKKVVCNFQIYTVPWLNKTSMENFSCHNA